MPFKLIELPTPIKGPLLLEPKLFGDERGFFMETYHQKDFAQVGITHTFVQDNQSRSQKGTLRGLHFQMTLPQAKLIRVINGRVFDVAVDLRAQSPTLGQWCGVFLDDQNRHQFYIPEGFAHGFLALSDYVDLTYKCSRFYSAQDEGGLLWRDSEIKIDWPLGDMGEPILSAKDREQPTLAQLDFRF